MPPRVAKPTLLDVPAYVAGQSKIAGQETVIKLSSNENPFGCSPKVKEAVQATLGNIHRYPDSNHATLQQAIAAHHAIDPARVICGAGSDEIISLTCQAFVQPGSEVLYSEHGFLMYPIYAKVAGGTPIPVAEKNLHADLDAMLARVNENTSAVFLASPNNPTGTYISYQALQDFHKELPPHVLLVVDEAYAEYVTAPDYHTALELADNSENVLVTRTFSKLYGIPALRLGWGYSNPAVMDILHRIRGPFNLTTQAIVAGMAALQDIAFTAQCINNNTLWREKLTYSLRRMGLDVTPSEANFVLVECPQTLGKTATDADVFLKKHGIIVRLVANYGLPNHLRISVGTEAENNALLNALTAFFS